jgi:beta-catenin-like protein 1
MLILLAGKNKAPGTNFIAVPALKCLDYVLSANTAGCERFIEALGLKAVFAVFMGRHAKMWRKTLGNDGILEQQTRSTSIVYSLFKNVENQGLRDRLCDRLIELWVEFAKRVSAEQSRLDADIDTGIELTEEEEYLQKLDAGLAPLEHLTMIFAHLWFTNHAPIMRRLYLNASQNSITLGDLRDIMRQHAQHVGDAGGDDARARALVKIIAILPYAPGERNPAQT